MTEVPRSTKDKDKQPESPPTLTPPDATNSAAQAPSRTVLLLVLACGLLLIIAALLVLFLPFKTESPVLVHQTEQSKPLPVAPQTPQNQVAANDDLTREIDRLMGVWLQKQAESEAVNIAVWGGDAYSEAVALAKECDHLLGEHQYLPAKSSCEEAITSLGLLMTSRGTLLESAVAAGMLAIEQGDPGAAASHFQQALAIDADDEKAAIGARRAEQLPTVLNYLHDGLAMEQADDLQGALLALREATGLDPEFSPAQEALASVRAEIAEQEFQQAMSRALQAMANGKLSTASSALSKAESLKPGDRTVRDLKQQLARTQLAGRLTTLQQDAQRLEQTERWPEALKTCEEALSLDSQAAFAVSCKTRVSLRVELDSHLNALFAEPERLFEDGPLKEARKTLLYASQRSPRGPLLTAKISQLDKLISQAEVEIEVVILSDGLTEVVVYHVGRLGLFQEKSLVLRTGNYTATGSRNGFKDVRQTLKVRPGSGKMVFTLRCEEPI